LFIQVMTDENTTKTNTYYILNGKKQ